MTLSREKITQLKEIIAQSLEKLYLNDKLLIDRGGLELSVRFRFAVYLQELIKNIDWLSGYQLDAEYDKNGEQPKRIPRRQNGVRPDIIIHSRGNNNANILVVEIKGWWNTTSRDDDYIKLEDFTDQRGEYKYGLGVFLELNQDNCEPEYFVNKVKERNNAR